MFHLVRHTKAVNEMFLPFSSRTERIVINCVVSRVKNTHKVQDTVLNELHYKKNKKKSVRPFA